MKDIIQQIREIIETTSDIAGIIRLFSPLVPRVFNLIKYISCKLNSRPLRVEKVKPITMLLIQVSLPRQDIPGIQNQLTGEGPDPVRHRLPAGLRVFDVNDRDVVSRLPNRE